MPRSDIRGRERWAMVPDMSSCRIPGRRAIHLSRLKSIIGSKGGECLTPAFLGVKEKLAWRCREGLALAGAAVRRGPLPGQQARHCIPRAFPEQWHVLAVVLVGDQPAAEQQPRFVAENAKASFVEPRQASSHPDPRTGTSLVMVQILIFYSDYLHRY